MKKNTLLRLSALGMLAFSIRVSGQITITTSDMPSVGLNVTTAKDTTTALSPGTKGTAETWAFGGLLAQKTASVMFMAPSATKYAAKFPAANLADSTVGIVGYNFFSSTASTFSVEGSEQIVTFSGTNLQIEINLNPMFQQSNLPATYGDIISGYSRGSQTLGTKISFIDSEKVTIHITYNDTIDAWGTMTTPTGTYSVLRQNHHEVDIDSVSIYTFGSWGAAPGYPTTTTYHQYNWYANGIGYILVQMNMNPSTGALMNTVWDKSAPAGINELSYSGKISVYPNPCTSQITFQSAANTDLQYVSIFDITGRQVEKVSIATGMVILNTGSYASGMYLYNILDRSGNIVDRGKFSVR